jgi:hypothetical protein
MRDSFLISSQFHPQNEFRLCPVSNLAQKQIDRQMGKKSSIKGGEFKYA